MRSTELAIMSEYYPSWYIKLKTKKMKEIAALIVDFLLLKIKK